MARPTYAETMHRLLQLIRAGYPVLYVISHEESRVLDSLARLARVICRENPDKCLFTWYEGAGWREYSQLPVHEGGRIGAGENFPWLELPGLPAGDPVSRGTPNALEAMEQVRHADRTSNFALSDSISVFFDLHPYLNSARSTGQPGPAVRGLRNTADVLRKYYDRNRAAPDRRYKTVIIVAPSAAELSEELERDLIKVEFPLPETAELRLELEGQMKGTAALRFSEGLAPADRERVINLVASAGRGLTLEDYRRGLNLFRVSGQPLSEALVEDMLDLKRKAINDRALEYTPHVEVSLGGLGSVEEWIGLRARPAVSESLRRQYRLPAPRGVMLCGVSGGGKSMLAKLIAKVFNLALLRLDVGALFGSYIGESEENTRRALMLAESLAPVVLWLDEIDKAFAGVDGGGDSGVSSRVFAHFLTWLSEPRDNVFVVATANDFRRVLTKYPEFGRKGRFDEIFWVGLPDRPGRRRIFDIYLRRLLQADGAARPYLSVTAEQLAVLSAQYTADFPKDAAPFDQFCALLSHPRLSDRMTGAEIEYAVVEALYEAYDLDQRPNGESRLDTFTPEHIARVVRRAHDRCLYRDGSPADGDRKALEGIAAGQNWIFVGATSPQPNDPGH